MGLAGTLLLLFMLYVWARRMETGGPDIEAVMWELRFPRVIERDRDGGPTEAIADLRDMKLAQTFDVEGRFAARVCALRRHDRAVWEIYVEEERLWKRISIPRLEPDYQRFLARYRDIYVWSDTPITAVERQIAERRK